MPGVINSYDPETRRAVVTPAIQTELTEPNANGQTLITKQKISNVPVLFPGGSGYSFTFNLSEGDTVILLCCKTGIANFKSTEESETTGLKVVPPDPHGGFAIKDAVALAGFSNESGTGDGVQIAGAGGTITINNESGISFEANDLTIKAENISIMKGNTTYPAKQDGDNLVFDSTP